MNSGSRPSEGVGTGGRTVKMRGARAPAAGFVRPCVRADVVVACVVLRPLRALELHVLALEAGADAARDGALLVHVQRVLLALAVLRPRDARRIRLLALDLAGAARERALSREALVDRALSLARPVCARRVAVVAVPRVRTGEQEREEAEAVQHRCGWLRGGARREPDSDRQRPRAAEWILGLWVGEWGRSWGELHLWRVYGKASSHPLNDSTHSVTQAEVGGRVGGREGATHTRTHDTYT